MSSSDGGIGLLGLAKMREFLETLRKNALTLNEMGWVEVISDIDSALLRHHLMLLKGQRTRHLQHKQQPMPGEPALP